MSDALTWGALIASGASILAWVKFWMDVGSERQRITQLDAVVMATVAKVEMQAANLAQFKIEASRDFASTSDLADAERRFASAVDALGSRFDRMAERLDRVLESLTRQ
jgi:hypothetical protein